MMTFRFLCVSMLAATASLASPQEMPNAPRTAQSPGTTAKMGGGAGTSMAAKLAQLEQLVKAQRNYIAALEKRIEQLEKSSNGR